MDRVSADGDVQKCYLKGMRALELLREWRAVLSARLPGGTMEGLERDLLVIRTGKDKVSDFRPDDYCKAVGCVETAVRRIQGAGLLYFRNQPGVANRFAALSLDDS